MKKTLTLILIGCMIFLLIACGSKSDETTSDEPTTTSEASAEEASQNTKREPVVPAPANVIVGDYTLTAEYIPFEEPAISDESDSPDMDVLGNTVYVSDGGTQIKLYTLEESALTYVKTVTVEATGESISVDGSGRIYADGGVFEATVYDPETNASGKAVASGELTVSKNADFALTYFPGQETVTVIKDGTASDWTIDGATNLGKFENISEIEIVGDTVLIGGEDAEKYLIGEFDTNGNQVMLSRDGLAGSLPNAIAKTENGYISSSVSDMTFVGPDGAVIGKVDAKELFGIKDNTLWIYEMTAIPDGGILVLAQLSKSGIEGDETVLFKVSGF